MLDAQTKPIAGAVANLVGPGAARTATTDEHGAFRFLGIAPGLHALELGRPGLAVGAPRDHGPAREERGHRHHAAGRRSGGSDHGPRRAAVPGQPQGRDWRDLRGAASSRRFRRRGIPGRSARQVPGILMSDDERRRRRGASHRRVRRQGRARRPEHDQRRRREPSRSPGSLRFSSTSTPWTASASPPEAPIRRCSAPGVSLNLVTKRGTNRIARLGARPVHGRRAVGLRRRGSEGPCGRTSSGSGAPARATPSSAKRNSCRTTSPSAARRRTRTGTRSSRRSSSPRTR